MKKGDRVAIVRWSFLDGWYVEGHAELLWPALFGFWRVRFSDGGQAFRRIDPAAQVEPDEYVAHLNGKVAE